MRELCIKYNASVNVVLFLIVARAMQETHPDNRETISARLPMDMRKMLGKEKTLKNCSHMLDILNIKPDHLYGGNINEVMAGLSDMMKNQKDDARHIQKDRSV